MRKSESVTVYDNNTCIVFIEKNLTITIYLVQSWPLVLLVGFWSFNMYCSNQCYLGR